MIRRLAVFVRIQLLLLVSLLLPPVEMVARSAEPTEPAKAVADKPPKRIAAIVSTYHPVSHADVIVTRLLKTYTLDGKGDSPRMRLVSLYTDQVHKNDISRMLAKDHAFPIYDKVEDALTLGTGKLAVDGVLLVAEHGEYPTSKTGQVIYPKRRLFEPIAKVFEASSKVVPLFIDKHLADNWDDAKTIYDTCQRLKVPLMAGSSLPVLWRYPAIDVKRGARLKEVVAVSYHTLDAYGFHALEMVQSLVERRAGGETGVKSVQCLVGEAVWEAGGRKVYDPDLLTAALARLKAPARQGPPAARPGARARAVGDQLHRWAEGQRADAQRRGGRMVDRLARGGRRGQGEGPGHAFLDARRAAVHALHLSRAGHRRDDADRQAGLARRAHPADQRHARCAAHLQAERGRRARHAAPEALVPSRLELASSAGHGTAAHAAVSRGPDRSPEDLPLAFILPD